MHILRIVRSLDGPVCYIGAGAIRDCVWDRMSGNYGDTEVKDIDVVYFDPSNLSAQQESRITDELLKIAPGEKWDVKNQARVHLWFEKSFGYRVEPLSSIEDAVATWPEYASAIATRLKDDDSLELIAPYSLDDLLGMKVRRNPVRVTVEKYRERIAGKNYPKRWPKVKVYEE